MRVFAAMATPAVLLLANAMLILSTIQRIQGILARVKESEEVLTTERSESPEARSRLRRELDMHGRRVGLAHRALFSFYASAAVLLVMIVALGTTVVGWETARPIALGAAFLGAFLLLLGTALLARETWVGFHATDARMTTVRELCDRSPADEATGGSSASR